MATRFNRFYASELARLRENSRAFAEANPAVAPMLGSVSTDPDVERILEGVAFLNGLTRQKLDDEFPEIAQELASVLVPQFLRPLPAATLIAFTAKAPLTEAATIAKGTEIAANPIEGIHCRFRTTSALAIPPVKLESARYARQDNGTGLLQLQFAVPENQERAMLPKTLRLFLSGESSEAATLFMLLATQVERVRVLDQRQHSVALSAHIATPGFDSALLPYPDNAFPAFSWIQELLFMPQKFLFVEIADLHKAQGVLEGGRFRLEISLRRHEGVLPDITARHFSLHVTPAVNLFPVEAEPINLDHETADYPIQPHAAQRQHYQIYSIDAVSGYVQGSSQVRSYRPFSLLSHATGETQASYRTTTRPAMVGDTIETYLSVVYDAREVPRRETLSIKLTCTNRSLPERLKLGDVSQATGSSPERFSFRNITPVTAAIDPPQGEKLLWDVISHTTLNLLSLSRIETLKAMLHLYNSTCSQNSGVRSANERQIEGLVALRITPERRLLRGTLIQGQHILLSCDEKHWPNSGTLYLWGCVLERFLGCYAGINTYTRFELRDDNTGTAFSWPMRMAQTLIR